MMEVMCVWIAVERKGNIGDSVCSTIGSKDAKIEED